jgi:antirestriction protein ArdC
MAVPSRDPPNRGINVQALWVAADSAGYASGLWGTYKQWNSTGAQIRKGERATKAIFAGASKAQQAADWMHTRRQETAAA